ncbi:MAG: SIS domain-containing protein [Clostridiales bacterium]|nr:SIS domain-containing protein [Clostridiales bacterium]
MVLSEKEQAILDELIERYPRLLPICSQIRMAFEVLVECYSHGGKLLIAGNGGSCADAQHIVGELMKSFKKKHPLSRELKDAMRELDPEHGAMLAEGLECGLPAIAVTGHVCLTTAFANDVNADMTYAQQVNGYGARGDVFLGISTSGNAKNVDYAVTMAKAKGLKVIALTGKDGGRLGQRADVSVIVPETETYRIQEFHLPIYHALCLMLEEHFF